jgi:hypothetical protein
LREVAAWATEFQQYWDESFERLDELLKKGKLGATWPRRRVHTVSHCHIR